MADGSSSVDFTVRLLNQVTAPARQIQTAMAGVDKSFKATRKTLEAPPPKRGGLSDWDKMVSKARLSQTKDFAASHKKLTDAMAKPQDTSGGFGAIAGELGLFALAEGAVRSVYGAVWESVKAVGRLGLSFLEASESAAEFGQRSVLAIGFLTNDTANAAAAFDNTRHLAQSLGLDVEATEHSFQRLLAAQFSIGKSTELIKMGADLQAIGASADEVSGALLAITQIKSKGKLQAQEMLQLQERGISSELVYNALQKSLGKNKGQVQKMQQAGKITGDVAIEAIIDAIKHKTHESNLGEAGKAFADSTITGMRNQFAAGVSNFFLDVGKELEPGMVQLTQLVKGTIVKLAENQELRDVGSALLERWGQFINFMTRNWPRIEGMLVVGLHAVVGAAGLLIKAGDWVVEHWDGVSTALQGLTVVALGAGIAISTVVGLIAAPFVLAGAAITGVIGLIKGAIDFITEAVPLWYNMGKILVGNLVMGMLAMIPGVQATAGLIAQIPGLELRGGAAVAGATAASSSAALGGVTAVTEASRTTSGRAVVINGGVNATVQHVEGESPESLGGRIVATVHSEIIKVLAEHT